MVLLNTTKRVANIRLAAKEAETNILTASIKDLRVAMAPLLSLNSNGDTVNQALLAFANMAAVVEKSVSESFSKHNQVESINARYANRIMIYATGVVSAGKTSALEYIAQNTGLEISRYVLQGSEVVAHAGPFEVSSNECTKDIQIIELGNHLVFIDSPGVHSPTVSNAALAEQYLACADIVLFFTSSNSPGKVQEMPRLAKELEFGKPVVAVISRSDEQDEDDLITAFEEDREPYIKAKCPAVRKLQQDQLFESIEVIGTTKHIKNLVSVSIFCHQNNIEGHNLDQLDRYLSKLLKPASKRKAHKAALAAREVSKKVIGQHVQTSILPSLAALRETVSSFSQSFSQALESFEQTATGDLCAQAVAAVHSANDHNEVVGKLKALEPKLDARLAAFLEDQAFQLSEQLQQVPDPDISGFEHEQVPYREKANSGWKAALTGFTTVVGTVVGGVLGGPAGAVAGGTIGSGIGSAASLAIPSERTVFSRSGVVLKEKAIAQANQYAIDLVANKCQNLSNLFTSSLDSTVAKIAQVETNVNAIAKVGK